MRETAETQEFEFSRLRRTLPIALLRAREQVMERFRPMLQAHDVTEQQWRVLRVLHENQGMDATELADQASVLPPSLSRIIKALERRGLITVGKDPADGRRAIIGLSGNGADFIRQIAPESAAIYAEIEQMVGRKRIDKLLNDIEELIDALDGTSSEHAAH